MDAHGGRTTFRVSGELDPREIQTGRSGVITSFSSAGPTNYDHRLKPDVAAPGGQILSSTLQEFAGAPFAVFDGTSMAAPHVAGAAALLLQQHPGWTPGQVKSALMSSADPAWGDTARTKEASVLLEGGGLVDVAAANNPKLFAEPSSLSYGYLETTKAAARKALLLSLSDAGTGGGAWTIEIQPQAATAGAAIAPATTSVTIPPGGTVDVPDRRLRELHRPHRRQLRLRRAEARGRPGTHPVLLLGPVPADRPCAARDDQARPARRHRQGHLVREQLPFPDRAVRAASRLHREDVQRGRRRARLHGSRQLARRQRRGGGGRGGPERARRAVVPRLAERGRRAGLSGHAGQRERAHVRVPIRQRRRRGGLPARGALLRLGGLAGRPVHRPAAAGAVPAALLAGRRHPAALPLPDEGRERRAADARGDRDRPRRRRRSALAGDRLQAVSARWRPSTTRSPGSSSGRSAARRRSASAGRR